MQATGWMVRGAVAGWLMMSASTAHAQADAKAEVDLARALQAKHVALSVGLTAAAAAGKPISTMYEYEDAKLKLSVFTEKAGVFSEIFLDPATGKTLSTDKLTDEDDIKVTKKYSAAILNAKLTLTSALDKALAANPGYTAVSVTPKIKNGYVIAEVKLIKGTKFKTVTEPLA